MVNARGAALRIMLEMIWLQRVCLVSALLFFSACATMAPPKTDSEQNTLTRADEPSVSARLTFAPGAFLNSKLYSDPGGNFNLSVPTSWMVVRSFANFVHFTPGESGIATAQFKKDLTLDPDPARALAQVEKATKESLENLKIRVKNFQKGEWDDGVHQGYYAEYDAAASSEAPFDHYLVVMLPQPSGVFQLQFDALGADALTDAERTTLKQITASVHVSGHP